MTGLDEINKLLAKGKLENMNPPKPQLTDKRINKIMGKYGYITKYDAMAITLLAFGLGIFFGWLI